MNNFRESRIGFVDAMKGVAIILMVINHVPLEGLQWWRLIEVFHMPLFFLLSGYLYKDRSFKEVLLRNLKKILLPYFISCGIVWLVKWLAFHDPMWGVSILVGNGKGPEGYVFQYQVGPLWFLTAFFVSMILVNLLQKIKDKKIKWGVMITLFTISYVQVKLTGILLPFGLTTGVGGALFILLGIFMKEHLQVFASTKWCTFGLVTWIICVCVGKMAMSWHIYGLFLFQCIGGIFGTYLCYKFVMQFNQSSFLWKILCFIGSNTLAILCLHSIDRILNISTSLAELLLHNSNNAVMLWQLDLAIKVVFIIVTFVILCRLPVLKSLYQIKI